MQVTRFLKALGAGMTLVLAAQAGFGAEITGAGATFPYPIYAKWAEAYKAKTGNSLNYQSIGSGGGIRQIQNKTVDFGASDMPLKPEDLDKGGLLQFPTVIGGDVPVVNLAGVKPGDLKAARHRDRAAGRDPSIIYGMWDCSFSRRCFQLTSSPR